MAQLGRAVADLQEMDRHVRWFRREVAVGVAQRLSVETVVVGTVVLGALLVLGDGPLYALFGAVLSVPTFIFVRVASSGVESSPPDICFSLDTSRRDPRRSTWSLRKLRSPVARCALFVCIASQPFCTKVVTFRVRPSFLLSRGVDTSTLPVGNRGNSLEAGL